VRAKPKKHKADLAVRERLIDAAADLMREEGYGAVAFNKLAAKAGVKRPLIYYYFRTTDDLFIAVWRRYADYISLRQAQALSSEQPLRAMWEYFTEDRDASLSLEFWALARHRDAVRKEIAETGERFHRLQRGVFSRLVEDYGLKTSVGSADLLTFLITAASRYLVSEHNIGVSRGHADLRAFVERWLNELEGPPVKPGSRRAR
jgi:AcrR family transcriptional regulator